MKALMRSSQLHLIVVILVILDCICVSIELIIDLVVTMNNHNEMEKNRTQHLSTLVNTNPLLHAASNTNLTLLLIDNISTNMTSETHNHSNSSTNSTSNNNSTSSNDKTIIIKHITVDFYQILIRIENILKFVGLGILSFFVIEIFFKLCFVPRDVIKSKWGVFDAIVVFVSFILDIYLLKNKHLLHTVSGLLTLFR